MSYTNGIDGGQPALNLMEQLTSAKTSSKAESDAPGGVSGTDGVWQGDRTQLSAASGALLQGATGPDVRSAKVAALQEAIAAGTYSVPASAVADKLLESMVKQG